MRNEGQNILTNLAAMPVGADEVDEERYPLLGALAWYSLVDVRVTREQLQELYEKNDIDEHYLPYPIMPANAFRRATSEINTQWVNKEIQSTENPEEWIKITVKDIATKQDKIVRHVIAEIRNPVKESLNHKKVGQFVYEYSTQEMKTYSLPEFEQYVKEAETKFAEKLQCYEGKHVRSAIHSMIQSTYAVNVRPAGSVYFVPHDGMELLGKMEGLVTDLNQYRTHDEDGILESVPMLDVEKQRKLVFDKYESQCEQSVDGTMDELAKLLQGDKKVSKAVVAKYIDLHGELKQGIQKYEQLLERDMTLARAKEQLLSIQVSQLLDRANVSMVVGSE
jgi:hypothetical protein